MLRLVIASLFWLLVACATAQPLEGVTVVLDPGHGDRAAGDVPADPGATVRTRHGVVSECVFTWDTGMRLRRRLLELGAQVVLTLDDPKGDYAPKVWTPVDFPEFAEFDFKTLVEDPEPATVRAALISRVSTANRVYRQRTGPTYFFSLHFDSTAPEVAGVKFYYPRGKNPDSLLVAQLEDSIRQADRERVDLQSMTEIGLSGPADYLVLAKSANPNSYLFELGNVLSRDKDGGNPDLWRMRAPECREEYAEIISRALVSHRLATSPPPPSPPRPVAASAPAGQAAASPSLLLEGQTTADTLTGIGLLLLLGVLYGVRNAPGSARQPARLA